MDAAENGTPRSFMMPRCAKSAEMSRSDLWPPLGRLRRKLADQGDEFRAKLDVALTALDLLAGDHSLALPGALELGNNHRFVELTHGAEYLSDQLRCRRVVEE